MKWVLNSGFHPETDTIIAFMPAESILDFLEKEIDNAYSSLYANDYICVQHMEIKTRRIPFMGHFSNLIIVGFDNNSPCAFDDFRTIRSEERRVGKEC